jgi:hypothetical protein
MQDQPTVFVTFLYVLYKLIEKNHTHMQNIKTNLKLYMYFWIITLNVHVQEYIKKELYRRKVIKNMLYRLR